MVFADEDVGGSKIAVNVVLCLQILHALTIRAHTKRRLLLWSGVVKQISVEQSNPMGTHYCPNMNIIGSYSTLSVLVFSYTHSYTRGSNSNSYLIRERRVSA